MTSRSVAVYTSYMYIVLNDDPQANHYSLPAPFAPIFDAHISELLEIEKLPLGVGNEREPREESVEKQDIVLWHTSDVTHVTRPEGEHSFFSLARNLDFNKLYHIFQSCLSRK